MSFETTESAMRELGYEAGQRDGSWVTDGDTTAETAQAIISGYNDGDPEVMDMQPPPLSGERAGGVFIPDVLEAVGLPREYDGDDLSDLLDTYAMAYSDAWWGEVLGSARALV